MGDDADHIPVRENSMYPTRKTQFTEDRELVAQRAAQQRQMVARWSRDDLEDKYLRMYEENMVLKKHAHKQEDKIKRMATKLLRLVSDKKKNDQDHGVKKVRDIETEEMLEELHGKIRDLEKQNHGLREKLMVAKQQLSTQGKRTTQYGHVQSRINTGIPKAAPDPRITKNIRVTGPPPNTNRMNQSPSLPRYGHSLLEEARAENQQLEGVIDQLNEQINIYEQDVELLKEQMRIREAEYEDDLLKIKQQMTEGQRSAIQENIDIIRLQREVKEKATKMSQLQGQYRNLEDKLRSVKGSHDQVLHEMELLNHQLKDEQNRNLSLQNELKSGSANQRRLVELQERITDLERECDILKEANEKLVNSAFDLEREREWRQRENALKVQIAQLEATLKSDVGEKGSILDKLSAEREGHEELEEEHKQMRINYFQLKHEHEELQEKLRFFTQESAVDFQEIEEALMIVKKRREKDTQELDFLTKVDDEKGRDYEKLIRELQAEHADTINELEKTRNLLIVQHKINKDYQLETEAVTKKMDENKAEYDTKLEEYAQLLDIRAARIRKLEAQLRDVAYGTRQYRIRAGEEEEETSDVEEMDETIHLERGQNLFEIHIKRVTLTQEGLQKMGDEEPALFCTWEFYEHEIQATPVVKGPKPEFQFTSQYLVKIDDFFLHHLQKDSTTLEMHQSFGTDYNTVAACQLKMKDILEKSQGRLHGTVYLTGIGEGRSGVQFGTVEYWVRLRVPMEQALRLYKERSKALGYIDTNIRHTQQALEAMDDAAAQRPPDNINQLHIKVVCCKGLQSRRQDVQPSPYVVYKFFDYDDHDTTIIVGSNNPLLNDHKTYPVPVTAELDKYLKSQPLTIYVFDDTDPEETEYLGVAKVPLISLAHDKAVKGIFELKKKDGQVNGTVEVSLKWQYTYIPPRAGTRTAAQSQLLASAGPQPSESLPLMPGELDQLTQNGMVAGAPGTFPQTPARTPHPPAPRGPRAASTPTPAVRTMPTQELPVEVTVTPPTPTARRQAASFSQQLGMSTDYGTGTIPEEMEDSITEGSHVTGESLPVSGSESLASTPRGPPEDEIAPIPARRSREEGGSAVGNDMTKAKGLLLKAAIARRNKKPPPELTGSAVFVDENEETMEGTQEGEFQQSMQREEQLEETHSDDGYIGRPVPFPRRTMSLTQPYNYLDRSGNYSTSGYAPYHYRSGKKSRTKRTLKTDEEKTPEELIAEELGQTGPEPVSEDTMFGDEEIEDEEVEEEEVEEEEIEEEEVEEEEYDEKPGPTTDFEAALDTNKSLLTTEDESDSEGLVVARSPHPRPPSISTNPDVVIVVITSLTLHEDCRPMLDEEIKMLYVEYRLLGVPMDQTETPFSLPKPKPYESISFNFRQVFHVDFAKNYERRQYLASMLLPDDPEEGRIRITVVNEPLEEEEENDCQDVGVAFVSVRTILDSKRDLVDEDIPIYDIQDESTEIGTLKITVECLAALQAVQQEMQSITEA